MVSCLSVVAPCYNEELVLEELYRRLVRVCESLSVPDWELVLVNDGSRDRTWKMIEELSERDPHIVGVNLSRNHGHQLALTAGLTVCRGERILIIDADLQDPPELLPEMMKKMDEGADVVYGKRNKRKGESAFKLWTASAFYRIINQLSDTPIPMDTGDFRLMSRRALDALLKMPERHRFIRGMVSWIGFRQEPILYDRDARFAGETKYPLWKMVRFAVDAITSFSTKPLILAIWLGFASSLFSLLLLIISLVSWLFFDTVRGWTSLIAAFSLLSGLQFLVMGVIGQYLGRLYEQSKQRPLFIIQDIVRKRASDSEK